MIHVQTTVLLLQILLFYFLSENVLSSEIQYFMVPPTNMTKSPVSTRIVGGNNAAIHDFPWQASVIACKGKRCSICGGSLISYTVILTAAHCTHKYNKFIIGLGSNNLRSPVVSLTSTVKIEHPRYNPRQLNNDIALVNLPRVVKVTNSVQLVKLPKSNLGLLDNPALVSGFGRTSGKYYIEVVSVCLQRLINFL